MKRIRQLRLRSRVVLALVVGATVFGSVYAVAASLGVTSSTLGAGGSNVVSCDTDGVTVNYAVAYDSTVPGYKVSSATVSGLNAANCSGKTIKVTLTGASNASLAERTDVLTSATTDTLDFSTGTGSPVSAAAVTGVQASISG
jgi:hypothetical protein